MNTNFSTKMHHFVSDLQTEICGAIESTFGQTFQTDRWERSGGGGGVTCVTENGPTLEKGGVNVSYVHGTVKPKTSEHEMFKALFSKQGIDLLPDENAEFVATGISLVLHPHNPFAPTTHANYRYFECQRNSSKTPIWWFGGGADLTPYYLIEEDATHFHKTFKAACDTHNADYYPRFKQECDQYFYLPHRQETRGIGGIFYDYLNSPSQEAGFAFSNSVGKAFLPAYLPLLEKNHKTPFNEAQKNWQLQRRGRYVEFNLLYDRGTLFGLKTNGRIESILMSLPPQVRWDYDINPIENTPEAILIERLKSPKNWV